MLQKSTDIEVPELIEQAKGLIEWSPKLNNCNCFIPYIDEVLAEIRYLHFIKVNGNWVYVEEPVKLS